MTESICPVKLLQTSKSATLEAQVANQLTVLSNEAAVTDFLRKKKKNFGSVRVGRDVKFFRRLREQHFAEVLQMPELRPWSTLRDGMAEEERSCLQSDYSVETLPLILHQFFVDRIEALVRCRLMYMQRWARFHRANSRTLSIYDDYKSHVGLIMVDYDDSVQRADRLAGARDAYLQGDPVKVGAVKDEDVSIFLRDMVLKQQSWKKAAAFLTMLKWLPYRHFHQFSSPMDIVAWEEEGDLREPLAKLRARTPKASVQWKIAFERRRSSLSPTEMREEASSPLKSKLGGLFGKKSSENAKEELTTKEEAPTYIYCKSGTLASNRRGMTVPVMSPAERDYRPILEQLLVAYGMPAAWDLEAPSEHLKLFYEVSQMFKMAMERQQKQMTFRVYQFPKHLEDAKPEMTQEKRTGCNRAWLKEANWLDEVKLVPTVDPLQEEIHSILMQNTQPDELLELVAQSCHLHDIDKVMYSLKRHVAMVKMPTPVKYTSRFRESQDSIRSSMLSQIWKQILQGIDPHDPSFSIPGDRDRGRQDTTEEPENLADDDKQTAVDPFDKANHGGFDFRQANKVLTDQKDELFDRQKQKAENLKDAYMAHVMLRHLRIRDLRRTALSLLNYFRSVERTLTIGLCGLAKAKPSGKVPSSRAYLFEKPSDFQISSVEFMEFQEIENHDDFYSFESGRLHVRDQWMQYIVYDVAVQDLRELERALVLLGSHFITKGSIAKGTAARLARCYLPEEEELSTFSGQMVDRFAVLVDLWNCHVGFMERKRQLLDCYLEAYHNVFERKEKERLAQVMVDIISQRPRYVLQSSWFVRSYQLENECLDLHKQLIRNLLSSQILAQRQLSKALHHPGTMKDVFTVLPPSVSKFPLLLSSTTNQLEQMYMLEFHPSLCMASRVPSAIQQAVSMARFSMSADSVHNTLRCHRQVLEIAVKQLGECAQLNLSFRPEIKHALYHNSYLENPQFMDSVLGTHAENALRAEGNSGDATEVKRAQIHAWCDVLHFTTMFHRLASACLECAMLTKSYTELSSPLGFGAMHAFLRMASLDVAANSGALPSQPFFMTAVSTEGKDLFDQYSPVLNSLAVEEVDDKVFNLQLESKEDIIKMLSAMSMETFTTIVHAQVCQKNALTVGLLHVRLCNQIHKASSSLERVVSAVGVEHSADSQASSGLGDRGMKRVSSAQLVVGLDLVKQLSSIFLSLQLHKAAARDAMMQETLSQQGIGNRMNAPAENVRVKRAAVALYCQKLNDLLAPQALRVQIATCVYGLLQLLKGFPSTWDSLFECGKEEDDKYDASRSQRTSQVPSGPGMSHFDPKYRPGHARPRRLMSEDGKYLLNLFFLPHPLSVMSMFKSLELADSTKALKTALVLLSSFHDICSIACSRARLGCPIVPVVAGPGLTRSSSSASILNTHSAKLSGDWGGLEGVTNELLDLQRSIKQLPDPTSPEQVAVYLAGVRSLQYNQMVVATHDTLPLTLLEGGDEQGSEIVRTKSRQCIERIGSLKRCSLQHWCLSTIPEPLHVMKKKAAVLLPGATFLTSRGPFPHALGAPSDIGDNVHAAFCCLNKKQRKIAQGTLSEISLLADEVCRDAAKAPSDQAGKQRQFAVRKPACSQTDSPAPTPTASVSAMRSSSLSSSLSAAAKLATAANSQISVIPPCLLTPSEANDIQCKFLRLMFKHGVLRNMWLLQRAGEQAFKQSKVFHVTQRLYQIAVLEAAWTAIRRQRQLALAANQENGGGCETVPPLDLCPAPKNVGEVELREAQVDILVDELECRMLEELHGHAVSQLSVLQTEIIHDNATQPTDVWKKLYSKSSINIPKSAVVDNLCSSLLEHCEEHGEHLVIPKEQFEQCFRLASQESIVRDRVLYDCYSSYYEGMIQKAQHDLLVKEREIAHLQHETKRAEAALQLEVQNRLVKHCYPLVMEIIALRVSLKYAEEVIDQRTDEVRAEIHGHYKKLVEGMFETSFAAKKKMEDFRERVHTDVIKSLGDIKMASLTNMKRVRQRALKPLDTGDGSGSEVVDVVAAAMLEVPRTVDVQLENAHLNKMFFRLRTVTKWQRESAKQFYLQQLVDLQLVMHKLRSEGLTAEKSTAEARCTSDRQRALLLKRMSALHQKVAECEKRVNEEKLQVDQMQQKRDRVIVHKHGPRKPTQDDVDNLKVSLEEKDAVLHDMTEEFGRDRVTSAHAESRARKNIRQLQLQLQQERQLKQSAFEFVDHLQQNTGRPSPSRLGYGATGTGSHPQLTAAVTDYNSLATAPQLMPGGSSSSLMSADTSLRNTGPTKARVSSASSGKRRVQSATSLISADTLPGDPSLSPCQRKTAAWSASTSPRTGRPPSASGRRPTLPGVRKPSSRQAHK